MTFQKKLDEYMQTLRCSGKTLAERAELSAAVISRYRAGERTPARDSEQFEKLCSALAELAQEGGVADMTAENIRDELEKTLGEPSPNFSYTADNLNELISLLDINISELARFVSYDASYISRIRAGQRRPADPEAFCEKVSGFVLRRYRRDEDIAKLSELVGCSLTEMSGGEGGELLLTWLCCGRSAKPDATLSFIRKLDEFDLNEYIHSIHFDEIKVPTVPLLLPTSRSYYGTNQMKIGELDFLKATVLSKSKEPVFMCSDMPMSDMAEDIDFGKKWMLGIAMMLKKGLHLNMVHNLDRPFSELMLGLESWIPLYMTGQISPYYLQGVQNNVYCHFNYVSGAAALTGECISGVHDHGKYYLTNYREELKYFKTKAADILKKAQPLMEIYRSDNRDKLKHFLEADAGTAGERRGILTVPPLKTISRELLDKILLRADVSTQDADRIRDYADWEHRNLITILKNGTVSDEIHCLSREEFEKNKVVLPLSGIFLEDDITYNWEDYSEHLRLTQRFAGSNPGYSVSFSSERGFRNVQINIHGGQWALISKSKSPVIHFVIRHPKLLAAIESMSIPVIE